MKNLIFNLCLTLVLLAGAQSVNAQSRSLFVTDAIYGIIYEFTNGLASAQGTFAAGLSSPIGLAFDKAGNLFVLDAGNGNIYEYTNGVASEKGVFASGYVGDTGLVFDSAGNLFVSVYGDPDYSNGSIYEYTNGVATARGVFATGLENPYLMAFDSAGNMFVTSAKGFIYEITMAGSVSTFDRLGLPPFGLAFDCTGDLFVSDYGDGGFGNSTIYEYTNGVVAQKGTFASGLNLSNGLIFDDAGNLYEGDAGSSAIYEFTNGVATAKGIFAYNFPYLSRPTCFAFGPTAPTGPFPLTTNIVISPANPEIVVGTNTALAATGYFSNGSTNILVSTNGLVWSSSSPGVAIIDTNGLVTGLAAGVTTIIATDGSVSNSTTLTVVALPVISVQPTNNTVSPNGNVTLGVAATGGDLSYQWQLNGTNIVSATSVTYNIPRVGATNVGVYTVIVSNLAGSVTSQAAVVGTTAINMFAGMIINGPVGTNYLIQATTNLASGVWTTLTNVALPASPHIYIDYNSYTNKQQFYRAFPQ